MPPWCAPCQRHLLETGITTCGGSVAVEVCALLLPPWHVQTLPLVVGGDEPASVGWEGGKGVALLAGGSGC